MYIICICIAKTRFYNSLKKNIFIPAKNVDLITVFILLLIINNVIEINFSYMA